MASFATTPRPGRSWRLWGYGIGLALLGSSGGWAQDAFRASLAGQAAADAKKEALENQKFNVKLGPVSLLLGWQFGLEATDNVRYSPSSSAESDLIMRPQLNVTTLWRVTEKNSLNLTLGVGYDKYLRTTSYDGLFIAPDSDLSFDMYAKDCLINLHSRFSYSQEVAGDPTISGTGHFSRFENTSGILATWDLNKAVLTAGYDHEIYEPTESIYSQYKRASELGTVSAALKIRPDFLAGLSGGGGLTAYDEQIQPDYKHFYIGPFFSVQLSEYTSVRLAGGYVTYYIDGGAATNTASQKDAIYFDLTLRQRPGRVLAHTLSVGRQLQAGGNNANASDEYYARYSANWHLFRKTGLTTALSYQNISYQNINQFSSSGERMNYYGLGATLSRPITKKLTGTLGYQYYLRNSDVKSNDYTRNQLALNLIYVF